MEKFVHERENRAAFSAPKNSVSLTEQECGTGWVCSTHREMKRNENMFYPKCLKERGHFTELNVDKVFFSNATTCPCGLRGSPSWAWHECNRLLRLGRP